MNQNEAAINGKNIDKKMIEKKFDSNDLNSEFIFIPIIMLIIYVFLRVRDIFIIKQNSLFLVNDVSIYQFIRTLDLILLLVTFIFTIPMIINSKYIHKYLTIVIIFLLTFIGFDFLSFYFYFTFNLKNKNILFSLILDELWLIISLILFFVSALQYNDIHYLETGSDIVSVNFKNNNIPGNKSSFIKNNLKIK